MAPTRVDATIGQMRPFVLAIVAAVLLTGCMSRLTGVGGRITFAYPAVVDVANFNKPIAPGARLDLKALELGRGDVEMHILGAESADAAVLEIVGIEENAIVLQANAIGATRIEVTARDSRGRVVVDAVDMLVERPDHFAFEHDCTDALFAAYPANARISIPFSMSRTSGQPVVGYGFHPIKVTPKAALKLDGSSHDQGALHFVSTKARHRVAIRSTIDDSLIGLVLVELGDVDGLEPFDRHLSPTVAGAETMEFFVPTVAGVPLCQAKLRIMARSRTPAICEATAQLLEDEDSNRESVVRIIGRDFGNGYRVVAPSRRLPADAAARVRQVEHRAFAVCRGGHARGLR